MDNEEVLDDTQNIIADEESSEVVEEYQEPEIPADDQESDSAELERKNKELYARAKKAEEELKALKSKAPEAKSTNEPSQYATKADLDRLHLAQKYDEEVVDEIMRLGGMKALENPLVKSGIKALQAKKRSEAATPEATSRSPVYKRYTRDELMAMPLEEMEKILPKS